MSAHLFAGPLLVTVAYVLVYYLMITNQLIVRMRLRRDFGADREMLAADRYVGNMLEHMPPFLILLWLNAIFVGPRGATLVGAVYVVARLVYPLVMGRRLGKGVPTRMLFVTVIGYLVIAAFAVRLAIAALG